MRILGFWLKALALFIGAWAFALLGSDIENGSFDQEAPGALFGLAIIACCSWWAGSNWHESWKPDDDDHLHGTRRFRAGKNAQWLPRSEWRNFPDPLPKVPNPLGDPVEDIPRADVPPDENLRRLWLVRAHLVVHLNKKTSRARRRFPGPGTLAVASIGLASFVLMMIMRADPATGEKWVLSGLLGTAFLLWPFTHSLLGYMNGSRQVVQRRRALQEEEARLMALDAMRPGGPIGGQGLPASGTTPYVPPSLAQYRREPVTEEEEPGEFVDSARRPTLSNLGLTLKVLAVTVASGAFFVLGYGIENELYPVQVWTWFAMLGAGAVGLAVLGCHWHKSSAVLPLDAGRETTACLIAVLGFTLVLTVALVAWEEGDPWFLGTLSAALFLLIPAAWTTYVYKKSLRLVENQPDRLT